MSNSFVVAFEARIQTAVAKNSSASNIARMKKCSQIVADARIEALLNASDVNAERLLRAMYASFKAIELAAFVIDHKDANAEKNTVAVFRSALRCAAANMTFTKRDAECSVSRDQVITDEAKKNVLFQRNVILDEKTIAAQHQSSLDALVTLNILTKRADAKDAYDVHVNELAKALAHKLSIDMSAFEKSDEDDRVNADAE